MHSALGPTMAGIFVGFEEVDFFSKYKTPEVFFRHVDDTFCVFGIETEAVEFFSHLNCMHPALRFTIEKENKSILPFLDILGCKETSAFLTTVHRKPTFTGLYIRWDSFCPKKRKINLIKTLTHWVLMICSKLGDEVEFEIKPDSVQRCPVYQRLPWLGDSDEFTNQISACVRKCYFSSNQCVVFCRRTVLTSGRKDAPPPKKNSSSFIYSFICVCGLQYIGRTDHRLDSRIKQHVPTKILQRNYIADQMNNTYESSIAEHLINNRNCSPSYIADLFTILS